MSDGCMVPGQGPGWTEPLRSSGSTAPGSDVCIYVCICVFFSELEGPYLQSRIEKGYKSPRTYERVVHSITTAIDGLFPGIRCGEITASHVKAYMAWLDEHGVCEGTKRQYVGILGRMLAFATGTNVVAQMSIPWNECERRRLFIDPEDWPRIVEAVRTPNERLVLALGAFMGLRGTEMTTLRLDEVTDQLHIYGKGHGQGKIADKEIPESIKPIIAEYIEWRNRQIAAYGFDRSEGRLMVCCNHLKKGEPADIATIQMIVKQLRKRSGVNFSSHSLRRLYCTTLYDTGADLVTIARLMRHSSPDVTMKCYIDARPDRQREAVDRLTEVLAMRIN